MTQVNLDWFTHKTVLHEPAMMLIDPDEVVVEREWLEDVCKELKAARKVVDAARKLKPKQPSEVKLGEFLVEGWPDLILALRKLDGEK